jgi:hypothetical protein
MVMVPAGGGGGGAVTVTLADVVFVASTALVAVTVAVSGVAGAVNTPAGAFALHVTAVLDSPVTVAVKSTVPPSTIEAELGTMTIAGVTVPDGIVADTCAELTL